jgi:predicted MFS family arabinose efflux permease
VVTCTMGTLTVNINNTSLNLVLPQIRDELGFGLTTMQWVSASYVLILGALTMLGGALGDRFTKRTVLTCGLVVYICGSVLGAVSRSGLELTLSRALAAAGAATLVPVGLATLRVIAGTKEQLARYMSLWGLSVGLGMALGPVAGGTVTQLLGWRWFFVVMTVLGIVYLVSVRLFLPELAGSRDRRIDGASHLLLGGAMLVATAFFIELRTGMPTWQKVGLALIAIMLAWGWLHRNSRARYPVVPPQAFRDRAYSVSMLVAFLNYFALGATLFISALLLQDLYGLGPGTAGAVSVPLAAATACGSMWAGRRTGLAGAAGAIRTAATVTVSGVVVVGGGTVWFAGDGSVPAATFLFAVGSLCMGFGFGAANTPVNYLSMASLPKQVSGVAGSSASTSRQLGQSIGIATSGLLLGIGVSQWGSGSALAYLLPGLEIGLVVAVLIAVPRLYRGAAA